ncbi:MAG: hypothetical protein H0T79_23300 [Deltaproteobacteria bacterium]|nr:hypothetical protein [Deltaproteobacteria bacterium]
MSRVVLAAASPEPTAPEVDVLPTSDRAPYALVFERGQRWTLPVETRGLTASTSTQAVRCHVAEVELSCDHESSTIICDGDSQILAGTYTRTGRGLWRAAWNAAEATSELRDKTRMFARHPESLLDPASGKPVARPFHGGWCVSDVDGETTRTICMDDDKGIIGGSLAVGDARVYVGDVPRS